MIGQLSLPVLAPRVTVTAKRRRTAARRNDPDTLRRHVTECWHIPHHARILLLGLNDRDLMATYQGCVANPLMTAAYVQSCLARQGVFVSHFRVAVMFTFIGRPRGKGRSLPRPYKAPSVPDPPEPSGPVTEAEALAAMPPRVRRQLDQMEPRERAQVVADWRKMLEEERAA